MSARILIKTDILTYFLCEFVHSSAREINICTLSEMSSLHIHTRTTVLFHILLLNVYIGKT